LVGKLVNTGSER